MAKRECLFFQSKIFLFQVKLYIISYIFKLCFQFNPDSDQINIFACTMWLCQLCKTYIQPYN